MSVLGREFQIPTALPGLRERLLEAMQTEDAPDQYKAVAAKVAALFEGEEKPNYRGRFTQVIVINKGDRIQLHWLNRMRTLGAVVERIDCEIPGEVAKRGEFEMALLIHPDGQWEHAYMEEVVAMPSIVKRVPKAVVEATLERAGKSLRPGIEIDQ